MSALGQAVDQMGDAARLLACELAILQVDVVHDLADRNQRGVLETRATQQHFVSAAIAFMGELRFEHVEAEFPWLRTITLGLNKLECRLWVDEAADQPG